MKFIEKKVQSLQANTGFECTQVVPTSPNDRAVVHPVSYSIGWVMVRSLPARAQRLPVSPGLVRELLSMTWPRGAVDQPTISGRIRLTPDSIHLLSACDFAQ